MSVLSQYQSTEYIYLSFYPKSSRLAYYNPAKQANPVESRQAVTSLEHERVVRVGFNNYEGLLEQHMSFIKYLLSIEKLCSI